MKKINSINLNKVHLKIITELFTISRIIKMSELTKVNEQYRGLLANVLDDGDVLETRNHSCYSYIDGLRAKFDSFPLVTIRRTVWKKALREMEWFMSGDALCPNELLDWWKGQLDPDGFYISGYGHQLRGYTSSNDYHDFTVFDQIKFVFDALKNHPNSRRIITTTWHPEEMSRIVETNKNPQTPSTCHGTIVQYFVRNGALYLHTYQRSADLLLGVPHNWVQYWALLVYFSTHCDFKVGGMTWTFGDAHIYNDPSHLNCVKELLENKAEEHDLYLNYQYSGKKDHIGLPLFKASDFNLEGGDLPKPVTKIKPQLF